MAFKPGTDDIRESPALPVTSSLLEARAIVTSFDPVARHEAEKIFGDRVTFRENMAEAIAGTDAILVMTSWPHFDALPEMLRDLPNPPGHRRPAYVHQDRHRPLRGHRPSGAQRRAPRLSPFEDRDMNLPPNLPVNAGRRRFLTSLLATAGVLPLTALLPVHATAAAEGFYMVNGWILTAADVRALGIGPLQARALNRI